MFKGLLRSLLENAFVIFSILAILSAFVYVVVYPTLAATDNKKTEDDWSPLDSLAEESTPSPVASTTVTETVTGTLGLVPIATAKPKGIPVAESRPPVASSMAKADNTLTPAKNPLTAQSAAAVTPIAVRSPTTNVLRR